MLIIKLALRNILSAGLRTWLNVIALSFSFVAIVLLQGFYDGLNDQVEHGDDRCPLRRRSVLAERIRSVRSVLIG